MQSKTTGQNLWFLNVSHVCTIFFLASQKFKMKHQTWSWVGMLISGYSGWAVSSCLFNSATSTTLFAVPRPWEKSWAAGTWKHWHHYCHYFISRCKPHMLWALLEFAVTFCLKQKLFKSHVKLHILYCK